MSLNANDKKLIQFYLIVREAKKEKNRERLEKDKATLKSIG